MSKSTPAPPDYGAAAEAQAASSREVTEQQTWANRPTINTPFGQQTWEVTPVWDPSTGQYLNTWTQNTNLTPESQSALDSQMRLQQGRSNLAEGLLGRAQQEYGQPMNWSQFTQLAQAPQVPQYGQNLPGFEQLPQVPQYGQNLSPQGTALQGSDYSAMLAGLPQRGQGPQQNQYNAEDIQRQLSTEGLQNVDPSQRYYGQAGDAIYNQWANRQEPRMAQESEAMRSQLYNMGLKEGDEAYNREMNRLSQNQNDARQQAQYQATIGAGQEAQRMFGMDMGTRQQQFGERGAQGAFANSAAQQAMQQQLAMGGQRFQEQLAGGQFSDAQRAAALNEQFGAGDRRFSEQAARSQQMDAQRAAQLQEQMGIGAQQFQQQMQRANQGDVRRQQVGQEQLAFGGQQFNQQMQGANYQNQLRQQQIAEEMQRRGFSLNEINSILTGQQVGMPSMPSFNAANRSEGVQALQAAGMQSQDAWNAYNAQQQQTQGTLSGIAGAAMMFSDRRLKKDIVFLAARPDGLNLYAFRYKWEKSEQPQHLGVMADEVRKVYPDAVVRVGDYDMVNYERIPKH